LPLAHCALVLCIHGTVCHSSYSQRLQNRQEKGWGGLGYANQPPYLCREIIVSLCHATVR
jgi:hypothetical protein